jgi:DNA-binding IclR family transcriptional regulator
MSLVEREAGDGIRAIRRALDIVGLLSEDRPLLTAKAAIEATGLPRTTVLRQLETLERAGLLNATPRGYTAGASLLQWAKLAADTWALPTAARESMARVAHATGETVSVFVRQGITRVCIASEEGTQALRHIVAVGTARPMWAGAPSRVLLEGVDDVLLARIAAESAEGLDRLELLRGWRAEAADAGFAAAHGEREQGLSAVAVPVRDRRGIVVAAVAVAGPTTRFAADRVLELRDELLPVAEELRSAPFVNLVGSKSGAS